jgi:hypothetical protein
MYESAIRKMDCLWYDVTMKDALKMASNQLGQNVRREDVTCGAIYSGKGYKGDEPFETWIADRGTRTRARLWLEDQIKAKKLAVVHAQVKDFGIKVYVIRPISK